MALKQREFRQIVENAHDAIVVTEAGSLDEPGPVVVYCNKAFIELSGYSEAEILGKSPRMLQGELTDREQLDKIREALSRGEAVQAQLLNYNKAGERYWVDMSIRPIYGESGAITHFVAIERDITQWHQQQDLLYRMAVTDELTGLFNRRMFFEVGAKYLQLAIRHGKPLSVVMMDLDHFKRVNDRHGHQTGDIVLRLIGQVLMASVRESDVVARLGGEEFGLLLPETRREEAMPVVQRIQQSLAAALRQSDLPADARITMSVGVTLSSSNDEVLDSVMLRADRAMYAAKQNGRNRIEVMI